MAGKSNKSRERDTRPGVATSKWEWVAGAVGLVLVLGTVGFIAYNALTTEPSVPAVTVEHVGTERTPGGYVVEFRARNSGGATAASLAISGTLYDGSTEIETNQVTLDYLPPRGERQGGLIFQTDPAVHELRLEAEGYVDP
jgi:uncharacterized protein (TIGR02588 family)